MINSAVRPPDFNLSGKTAIVTGAAGRLGRPAALAFAACGARVVAADIDPAGAETTAAAARAQGAEAIAITVDVSSEASMISLVAAAVSEFGGLDIMFNNAGLVGREHGVGLLDLDTAMWDEIIAVNLRGVMLGCREAVKVMLDTGGAIINTSSDASLAGDIENNAYAAAKSGVNTLTRYVATAFGKNNIRCNAIAPGIHLDPNVAIAPARQSFYDRLTDHCLLPRLGTPGDIANAVVFLASDAAAYITGQVLSIDGGLLGHVPHLADQRREHRSESTAD
jgi:NAD(P)-dependent dehydrogenase (short-subunit alcohol dehydrogenase family)